MAIQHGINPFTGKIGDRIGRCLKGKFITQKAGGFTKEKWKNERETTLKRPNETSTEFGKCSKMAKAIYHGFDIEEFRANVAGEANGNLMSKLIEFLKYDRENPDGKRRPNQTAMQQLVGFQFNPESENTINEKIEITEPDKTTLKLTFNKGIQQLKWPDIAAAVQFFIHTYKIDFKEPEIDSTFYCHEMRKEEFSPGYNLDIPTTPGNCLLLVGFRFFEEVNGDYYLLRNKTHSPFYVAHYRMGD